MSMTVSEACEYLKGKNRFIILTHKNPDGDTVGSACALCSALRELGKEAFILENPGFSARYTPYINGMSVQSYSPDCVVCVDIADAVLVPDNAKEFAQKADFAVDHHESHREYARNLLLDSKAAACGEVVYKLIEELGCEITPEIATALYVAVSTDTGCFLHSSTTAESHTIAAKLLSAGVDINPIHREFFEIKSRARLAVEAELIAGVEFYNGGKTAVMKLTAEAIKKAGATEDDLDNISSLARAIEGVELGILVREMADGKSKLSLRSSVNVNSAEICGKFGGGGHNCAAGCTISATVDEAGRKICEQIDSMKIFSE